MVILSPTPGVASGAVHAAVCRSVCVVSAAQERRARPVLRSRAVRTRGVHAASAAAQQGTEKNPTLFTKLGGAPAVKAAVDVFYDKVMADDRLNYFFEGIDMRAQRAHQAAFLSYALGGSTHYNGNGNMTAAHQRLVRDYDLRMEHFDLVLQHLGASLKELGVPDEDINEAAGVVETLRPAFQEAIDAEK